MPSVVEGICVAMCLAERTYRHDGDGETEVIEDSLEKKWSRGQQMMGDRGWSFKRGIEGRVRSSDGRHRE